MLSPERIVFDDGVLLVVDKPPGIPTAPTRDPNRVNLLALVRGHLADTGRPADDVVAHHRLDRDTSGVVVFSVDRRANAALGDAFAERRIEKRYFALTHPGTAPRRWTVDDHLAPVPGSRPERHHPVHAGGRRAVTDFVVLERLRGGLVVQALPRTGRTHQIRVHLAGAGLPIFGDPLYGAGPDRAPRLMLHAAGLTLVHPLTGEEQSFTAPLPVDWLEWRERLRLGRN